MIFTLQLGPLRTLLAAELLNLKVPPLFMAAHSLQKDVNRVACPLDWNQKVSLSVLWVVRPRFQVSIKQSEHHPPYGGPI